jgi:hypothetical protein
VNGKEAVRLALVSVGAALALQVCAGSASAAVLHDQTDNASLMGIASMRDSSDANMGSGDLEVADDFTVPAGQRWTIESVFVDGINDLLLPAVGAANVRIYSDNGTSPGVQLFAGDSVVPVEGPDDDYTVPTPGAMGLNSGTYWISVQAVGDYPDQIWDWTARTTQSGKPAVIATTVPGIACPRWTVRGVGGCPTASGGPDQVFRLNGSSSPAFTEPTKKKCKKKKKKKGKKRIAEAAKKKSKKCKKKKKKK